LTSKLPSTMVIAMCNLNCARRCERLPAGERSEAAEPEQNLGHAAEKRMEVEHPRISEHRS
jgi:hypothetical protein